jgi:hypothetical protein
MIWEDKSFSIVISTFFDHMWCCIFYPTRLATKNFGGESWDLIFMTWYLPEDSRYGRKAEVKIILARWGEALDRSTIGIQALRL